MIALASLAILLALLPCVGFLGAYVLLHPAGRRRTPLLPDGRIPYEAVSFITSDGLRLWGLYAPLPEAPAIVYCPGRGGGLNEFDLRHAQMFHGGGYQVLMFDWRGTGGSEGHSSMGYWEQLDVQAAIAYLRQRGVSQAIGAFGVSLGAAVLYLAAGRLPDVQAVAGESGFAVFEDVIRSGLRTDYAAPDVVARPLAWLIARCAAWQRRFSLQAADPVHAIRYISPRPVFIIHGKLDQHVPVSAARQLFAAAGEPKEMWLIDAGHTEGLTVLAQPYAQRLLRFYDRRLKTTGDSAV